MFIIRKETPQIKPPSETAQETPQTCARKPAKRLPKGIIPAKVNIKTLIILPLNLSGANVWSIVLIRLMEATLENPINNKVNSETRYILDTENATSEMENIINEVISSLPLPG